MPQNEGKRNPSGQKQEEFLQYEEEPRDTTCTVDLERKMEQKDGGLQKENLQGERNKTYTKEK